MPKSTENGILQAIEITRAGYAGVLPNGNVVDRREHPTAVPVQANRALHIPKPKSILPHPMEPKKVNIGDEPLTINLEGRRHIKKMVVEPTREQLERGKIGRNDPCLCGSGRKFKVCCQRS